LHRGLFQVGVGIALGTALGWALLGLLQFIPTGMASGGGAILALSSATMLAAGLLACLVPAARALAIHPVEALRHE
jgi:ABC-type antimicrobial peptide transport system permease subunit